MNIDAMDILAFPSPYGQLGRGRKRVEYKEYYICILDFICDCI
jgi:hypothetical protein